MSNITIPESEVTASKYNCKNIWAHQEIFIFGIVSWGIGILEVNYNFGFGLFLLFFGGFICLFEILFNCGVFNSLL